MRDSDTQTPYYVAGGWQDKEDWHFFVPKGQIRIRNCAEILGAILPLCNGHNRIPIILEKTKDRFLEHQVRDLMAQLFACGVLADAHEIYRRFYAYSRNKMPFARFMTPAAISTLTRSRAHLPPIQGRLFPAKFDKTPLHDWMDGYSGTRQYSGQAITRNQLFSLLWCACGKKSTAAGAHHDNYTVISGGDLYPLTVYLLLFQCCGDIEPGVYRWRKEHSALEALWLDDHLIDKVDETILFGVTQSELSRACGVFCIVADFARSSDKYSNKAYDLIQQEVGHVVANLSLCSAQQDIGLFKCGGYDHGALADLLGIDFPNQAPLTTAVFGSK